MTFFAKASYFKFIRHVRTKTGEIKQFRSILHLYGSVKEAEKEVLASAKARGEDIVKIEFVRKSTTHDALISKAETKEELSLIKNRRASKSSEKFSSVQCKYCEALIPKNGAAQFSHLKKHLAERGISFKVSSVGDIKKLLEGKQL